MASTASAQGKVVPNTGKVAPAWVQNLMGSKEYPLLAEVSIL